MSEAFQPEIVVLYCGRSINKDEYLPEGTKKLSGGNTRFVRVPCSSKIETGYLVKLIEEGVDGIVVVACPEVSCQFLIGSLRASGRVAHARALLDEVGMGGGRLGMVQQSNSFTATDIMAIAEERIQMVLPLGQNPMRRTR
ncbi:MAG: hydrogenase iron-sulfur subunit [Chloroflexota bacterium]|nr:hydrogenase iron-sulfur subunit [Chloroflexota bacterium]